MNPLDRSLQRLFRAASRAPRETPEPPSFAPVLAAWRSTGNGDEFASLARLFRQAVICASVIMVLSVGWSWFRTRTADATELANYAMTIQLPP